MPFVSVNATAGMLASIAAAIISSGDGTALKKRIMTVTIEMNET